MSRRLLLLDVTQMSGANVCVAGQDVDTGENIRLADPQPTRALLRRLGGICPGDLIGVDASRLRRPEPPHTEDARWRQTSFKKLRSVPTAELIGIVERSAFGGVEAAFGARILPVRGNSSWPARRGARSLATVDVKDLRCSIDARGTPRVAFVDADGTRCFDVPFQDLRAKSHYCERCDAQALSILRNEFNADRCVIRVGLTRPYSPDERAPACWLQVTNIFARERTHFV